MLGLGLSIAKSNNSRALNNNSIIADFTARVEADGGDVEARSCLVNDINELKSIQ